MSHRLRQHGGFTMGLIVGLLVGLALALGVALYVTKAPNPFVNKVPQRSPVQDAAETERNRNWDPNAPLAGKNPARPSTSASTAPPAVATAPMTRPVDASPLPTTPASAVGPSGAASKTAKASAPATGKDPAATAAAPRSLATGSGSDPFSYFVQAGAYGRTEDAEQQRARLAMLGIESRLTEREQGGHTVFRVRVGPFDRKDDADRAKEKLSDAGVDSALVRVQK
ncbi:MAG: SPOR domain-containing protein [Caldimonas sp.]